MCLQGGRGGGAHLRILGEDTAVSRLNFDAQLSIPYLEPLARCLFIPNEIPQILDEDLHILALAIPALYEGPQLVFLALRLLVLALACGR